MNRKKTEGKGHQSQLLSVEDVKLLRTAAMDFTGDTLMLKHKLLLDASSRNISSVDVLTAYHDCLLFLLAYPENKELFKLATNELKRVAFKASLMYKEGNQRIRKQLSGTGIAFTPVHVAFGFDLATWLAEHFALEAGILESDGDKETLSEVLMLILPEAEREYFQQRRETLASFIQRAKGNSKLTDLQWLLQLFEAAGLKTEVRDHIYDKLKLYITWHTTANSPSRTFARSIKRSVYFHRKGLVKQPDAGTCINQAVIAPDDLDIAEKAKLIDATRGILAMLERETDPASYADTDDVKFFSMGRGIDIMLYPMKSNRRLPFDSYIGYTVFKNSLPVAYGGGWIFQQRCKMGINVLEAYRGGESAYLFLQVLRLYHHFYGVSRFIIEPYQIGYKNPEGIKSGAFWFYYRLGFVPEKKELQAIAAKEYEKICTDRNHRSPVPVLKALSVDNMQLTLNPEGQHHIDALQISCSISNMIRAKYNGDRKLAILESTKSAIKVCSLVQMEKKGKEVSRVIENFSLLLQLFEDISKWTGKDKKALKQLILLKAAGSEHQYVNQFRKHVRLNEALALNIPSGSTKEP